MTSNSPTTKICEKIRIILLLEVEVIKICRAVMQIRIEVNMKNNNGLSYTWGLLFNTIIDTVNMIKKEIEKDKKSLFLVRVEELTDLGLHASHNMKGIVSIIPKMEYIIWFVYVKRKIDIIGNISAPTAATN